MIKIHTIIPDEDILNIAFLNIALVHHRAMVPNVEVTGLNKLLDSIAAAERPKGVSTAYEFSS